MVVVQQAINQERGRFLVGGWLVEPDLNQVSNGAQSEKLEPMAMVLLVFLAQNRGQVVTRQQLHDEVWQQEFVSDSTVSSAITVLRRALRDDARNPRFIETIPKRGYRLIAEVAKADAASTVTLFPGPAQESARSPYPGLMSFRESDAEHFFGRKPETTTLWEKIRRQKLLAVIGPSGVGKSSFLRAGMIPAAPDGWDTLIFEPGRAPFESLARALLPLFAGDTNSVRRLVGSQDPDVALSLVSRWRERWTEVLLVVDQFEELFTLNPTDVQNQFADFLARLASAAEVHVVLVMRDDFLFECHAHLGLAPVFNDLTALGPLAPADLQRALVEPARRQGYRFEHESLARDIVEGTAGERGAMPMLAFTASRLWEKRDRGRQLITLEAYGSIGGVGGALAHHAEEVMKAIGHEHIPLAREIFRNLLTGAGTRAVRDVGELLSVFAADQRQAAMEVLQKLINARLLTAFEDEAFGSDPPSEQCRVEIVHESLLTHWPRLVRWQAQDAEGVQLRQELRQAAQTWDDHDRPDDLLWTGTAFREFLLWREHYPGRLTTVEEDFAQAMLRLAGRKKRRRRLAVGIGLIAVLVLSAVMTTLWLAGVREARRADAKQLFLEGKVNLEYYPVGSFSNAVTSLEMVDDPEVRRFALEALWRTPMPVQVLWTDSDPPMNVTFSSDGRWLAAGYLDGTVRVMSSAGGDPVVFQAQSKPILVQFAPDSKSLAAIGLFDRSFRFYSVPDGWALSDTEFGSWPPLRDIGDAIGYGTLRRLIRITRRSGADPQEWTVHAQAFDRLAYLQTATSGPATLDPAGERLVFARQGDLFIEDNGGAPSRHIATHQLGFEQMAVHPDGDFLATIDTAGEVQLWSLVEASQQPVRTFKGDRESKCWDLGFDPTGALLAATQESGRIWIWGLDDPPGADPMRMVGGWAPGLDLEFDPSGRWLTRCGGNGIGVWPIDRSRFGYVLPGHSGPVEHIVFAPNDDFMVSAAIDGEIRLWSLGHSFGRKSRVLTRIPQPAADIGRFAIAADGSFLAIPTGDGVVRIMPVDDGPTRDFAGFQGRVVSVALSPDGRLMAAGGGPPDPSDAVIRVWDLGTGEATVLDEADGEYANELSFTADGALLAAVNGKLYKWDLESSQRELLLSDVSRFVVDRNGEAVLTLHGTKPASFTDFTNGTTVQLTSHGDDLHAIAIGPDGKTVVTGARDRIVRVGSADGEAPHLLYGHRAVVKALAVSWDGKWIASGSRDGTIRLWHMPSGQPFHTLPREEFFDKLRALRSYRRVPSRDTLSGFTNEPLPFRGWQTTVDW